jgi:pepF/M3 family oligoendopeptidase
MNYNWNLDTLYKSFDDPAFAEDQTKLEQTLAAFTAFTKELSSADAATALVQGISLLEQISLLVEKLATYAVLRQTADTRDASVSSRVGQIMNLASAGAAPEAAFKDWASKLPELSQLVEADDLLKAYAFYFEDLQTSSRYLLPGMGEQILAKLQLSGGNAWSELQQYLTSTLTVSFRGEEKNLSQLRNLASDADPSVRKEAYEAELAAYPRIRDSVAYALNSIKLETLSECELRGYDSPLARTLSESHLQQSTLEAMLSAMDEYLPKFWKYLKCKAKALGHDKGLPWYDLFAPMGACSTKFTPESAGEYLVKLFRNFDDELGELIATAFDQQWIDFFPREGKSGGAFCAEASAIGQSRILTNFDGTFSSVVTLAHELGHAFHNHCIFPHRPLNHQYSMPLAETASTFNECVVMGAAIREAADDAERINLIESQLQDTTQIICDIYSRYRFEAEVFHRRSQEFMDADTLCDMMLSAQKQCYGDGLDPSILHPYMWLCKSHYYGPIFYNFPYAFGGLFARGLYARYEQEGVDFLPKYKKLLYTTTVATAEETAKVAGIDLTDRKFWCDALQTIADQIDLLCTLLEDNQ